MQRLSIKNESVIKEQIYRYLNSSSEAKFIHRIHGLLLLIDNKNNNCSNVAELFDNSPRTISNWIHSINETNDINILRDKTKQGRKPRLTEEQEVFLKESISKHPSESGLKSNLWDGKTLSHFIMTKYGIKLKVRQCQRLFHKLGFSLKRGRPVPAKGDEEKKTL